MSKCLPVVSLLALGLLPGCIFVADSTSDQDGSRVSRLEKRVATLERQMEDCGEDCCNGEDKHEHEAPKAQAQAQETPKPATGGGQS